MIPYHNNHDESQGLDAFFVMYEQFKSLKIVRYTYAVLDIKHQQFYEKEPTMRDNVLALSQSGNTMKLVIWYLIKNQEGGQAGKPLTPSFLRLFI